MKIKIIIKTIGLAWMCYWWNTIQDAINPIIKNTLAMEQMGNNAFSSSWIQIYNNISDKSILFFVIIAMILFSSEIEEVIYKLKEKRDGKM